MDNAGWNSMAREQRQGSSWNDSGKRMFLDPISHYTYSAYCFVSNFCNYLLQVFLGQNGVRDLEGNELPRLVYVSREKRPGFDHHKKAGAMNALVYICLYLSVYNIHSPFTNTYHLVLQGACLGNHLQRSIHFECRLWSLHQQQQGT